MIDILVFIVIVIMIPVILSIPALNILKKRGKFYPVDYGLSIYGVGLFIVLLFTANPSFGFSNVATEPVLIIILSIIINYLKLLAPKSMSGKILSALGISIILVATALIFFFFPSLPE